MHEFLRLSARETVARLRRRDVGPVELTELALDRIVTIDGSVNAVPTVCAGRARARARAIEAAGPPDDDRGWLAGLPVVVKDLVDVRGVRTTYGSRIFADHVPDRSAIEAQRLEDRGAVILGKSNTPEFGAGANTFNEVFGATRNPWDTRLTCGGSSGGAAVALATGMAWLADGSDLGGSLRTPAAFCSVVGLRASPGRVPHGPSETPFQTLSVTGPMARDVRDVALMLDAQAGFDPRDPLSFDAPAERFVQAVERRPKLDRVAFSADLGGVTPVDPEVAAICGAAAARLGELGAVVEEACPDLGAATAAFTTLRAASFAATMAPLLESNRSLLKPEVIWNIERGLALDADAIGRAERQRGVMQAALAMFLTDYDLLCCPAAVCPPFPVEQRWLETLGSHRFASYIDWVSVAYAITLTGCPALSLPCGFTAAGLPVGLQLVAAPRGEARLLALAAALEDRLNVGAALPIDPRTPSA